MSTATLPRLTSAQRSVLASLPEPSGKNKRTYAKLVDIGLVVRTETGFELREDGENVVAALRTEGLVPEAADDSADAVAVVEEAEEADAAPAEVPAPKRTGRNPARPGPGLFRKRNRVSHVGDNPLPFEDDTHFTLRSDANGSPRGGEAFGSCRECEARAKEEHKNGTFKSNAPNRKPRTPTGPVIRNYSGMLPNSISELIA